VRHLHIQLFAAVVPVRLVEEVLIATVPELEGVTISILLYVIARFTLNDTIDGFDKAIERNAASRLAGIKEFSNLDNLFLREGVRVLAKQLFELIGIDSERLG